MEIRNDIFGWFDSPYDKEPAHDPTVENGKCLVCTAKMSSPLYTICLALQTGAEKSYFFRVHQSCWNALTEVEQSEYESSLIDNI